MRRHVAGQHHDVIAEARLDRPLPFMVRRSQLHQRLGEIRAELMRDIVRRHLHVILAIRVAVAIGRRVVEAGVPGLELGLHLLGRRFRAAGMLRFLVDEDVRECQRWRDLVMVLMGLEILLKLGIGRREAFARRVVDQIEHLLDHAAADHIVAVLEAELIGFAVERLLTDIFVDQRLLLLRRQGVEFLVEIIRVEGGGLILHEGQELRAVHRDRVRVGRRFRRRMHHVIRGKKKPAHH